MATPKEMFKGIVVKITKGEKDDSPAHENDESGIKELVERVFTTRNLTHFSHWDTNSFAAHSALGELYENIVGEVDNLVETYFGEFGKVSGFETESAKLDGDIIERIRGDFDWVKSNRSKIACGSTTIENLIDGVLGAYSKTLYKLKNLR